MPLETFPYDAAEYLDTAETIAWFIQDTVAGGEPSEFGRTLEIVGRARRMHGIAGRKGAPQLDPAAVAPGEELATLLAVLDELGFRLTVEAVEPDQPAEAA